MSDQKDIYEIRYEEVLTKIREHFKNKTVIIKADHEIDNASIGWYEYGGANFYDHQDDYVIGGGDFIFPEVFDNATTIEVVYENLELFLDELYGDDKEDIEVEVYDKDGKTIVSIGYVADPVFDYDPPDRDDY